MTKVDGYGNRYELMNEKAAYPGFVRTCKNGQTLKGKPIPTDVDKASWDRWDQVADSSVKQEGFEF